MEEDKMKKLGGFFTLIGGVTFGDFEKVKKKLDQGENINGRFIDFEYDGEKDPNNPPSIAETDTPLLIAVKTSANAKIIKLLLERGADLTIKDENGKIPIEIAKERKLTDIIEILEDHKTRE